MSWFSVGKRSAAILAAETGFQAAIRAGERARLPRARSPRSFFQLKTNSLTPCLDVR